MDLLENLGFGLALGFSLTVPPGPMNAVIASAAARSSRAGTVMGLGAMSADLILAAVVFSLSATFDLRSLVRPVDALGAVALAYFGVRLLARRGSNDAVPPGDTRSFSQALALGLTNPFQIIWWFTAGLAFARLGGAVLLVGLFGAVATWVVVFPLAIHAGVRRYPGLERAIVLASGAILLVFAAYFALLAA
ncbi:MAG TPA: LysE family transporter [Thermoplasmata archaeon]|nr:LysE family transporter [Thermoplasmata archaeon]